METPVEAQPLDGKQEILPCTGFGRPWLGVLLSFLVPGFGLLRARQYTRGVLWLIGSQLLGLGVAFVWITRAVPTAIAMIALAMCIMVWLWLLRDSYRAGRMTPALWLTFLVLFIIFGFAPSLPSLVFHAFSISTDAMAPTLVATQAGNSDHIVVNKAAYWFSEPQRGDLAVFRTRGIKGIEAEDRYQGEMTYVKRLIGLPGETIEIRDGHVFANGRQLGTEDGLPMVQYVQPSFTQAPASYPVPKDAYFMLGDNSPRSSDSRYWGYVPKANVMGKVARIYWPPSRMSVPK
jgi:signal peptidase I